MAGHMHLLRPTPILTRLSPTLRIGGLSAPSLSSPRRAAGSRRRGVPLAGLLAASRRNERKEKNNN